MRDQTIIRGYCCTKEGFFAMSFQKDAPAPGSISRHPIAIDRPRFERVFADTPFCRSREKINHMRFRSGPRGDKMPIGRKVEQE